MEFIFFLFLVIIVVFLAKIFPDMKAKKSSQETKSSNSTVNDSNLGSFID